MQQFNNLFVNTSCEVGPHMIRSHILDLNIHKSWASFDMTSLLRKYLRASPILPPRFITTQFANKTGLWIAANQVSLPWNESTLLKIAIYVFLQSHKLSESQRDHLNLSKPTFYDLHRHHITIIWQMCAKYVSIIFIF